MTYSKRMPLVFLFCGIGIFLSTPMMLREIYSATHWLRSPDTIVVIFCVFYLMVGTILTLASAVFGLLLPANMAQRTDENATLKDNSLPS